MQNSYSRDRTHFCHTQKATSSTRCQGIRYQIQDNDPIDFLGETLIASIAHVVDVHATHAMPEPLLTQIKTLSATAGHGLYEICHLGYSAIDDWINSISRAR